NLASNPTATPVTSTTYTVTVVDGNGCFGFDTVRVNVLSIDVISGFTPDGNGINDTWVLSELIEQFPDLVVEVYNRYGQLLFQSSNGYPVPWDGTFEGSKLPVGTYYYYIDLKDSRIADPLTGPVTILK
ncbi:MAG: gliding motility-associated C-terminal domain-containing protein, partial [Bacteroidota bacterium]